MKRRNHKRREGIELTYQIDFRRKGKKRRRSVSPDPWAQLAKPIPFNQPAEAPPTLTVPTKKAASSLPKSLTGARKEILEQERQDVITRYRKLMGRN